MSMLFDTSPQDDAPKRKSRRKPAADQPATVSPEPELRLPEAFGDRPILGRVDGDVACLDSACRAECHDITDEHRGRWRLECCFCGTGQWIPAIDGRLDEPPKAASIDFVFPAGQRGAGCTVAEYHKVSPEYVAWAAKNEPNEIIREACETYLASLPATR